MADKNYDPAFNVYVTSGEGRNQYWTKVGAAFSHRDGKAGYNIVLSALPLGNKLILIDYEEDKQRREEAKQNANAA